MLGHLRLALGRFYPGYFALVMATGIVSLAAFYLEYTILAWGLFLLNIVQYVIIGVLMLARLCLARTQLLADLTSHGMGPAFLTAVAGSCILGTQCVVLAGQTAVAEALWLLSLVLWLVLIYTFFTSVTIKGSKPNLGEGMHGGWLLPTVSTQALAVLGILLAPGLGEAREPLLFLALCFYLLGSMFYLLIITLILYRFTFFPMTPMNLSPPYWINMGAVAITTMAGTRLILSADHFPLLTELLPFLKGFTLFFWATATWWIPQLLILGDWRYVIQRTAIAYHPSYWAMVFPLGMYTASTFQLARALDLPFLLVIPQVFFYVALAAWCIVYVAMLVNLVHCLRPALTGEPSGAAAVPPLQPTTDSVKPAGP